MALSAPRAFFGVHSVSPYNRTTGEFYGILKVLQSSSLSLSGETVDLMGGSQKYAWASEDGPITAEMTLNFNQYEDFVFELFLGTAPTSLSAEATGDVSTIANKNGTSAVNASTGIASVAATGSDEADLKFGKYVVKVVTATTVDIYLSTDADIGRGTDATYQNNLLKVTSSPITISNTGGTTAVADLGLTFTGGSGTVAMTTGDTATFEVRPVHGGGMTVTIGAVANQTFPEFGAIVMAQKRGNQEMMEIDCFRCKAVGMPINFEKDSWSAAEVNVKLLYDTSLDGLFSLRYVQPT